VIVFLRKKEWFMGRIGGAERKKSGSWEELGAQSAKNLKEDGKA
jgi:hypothetical protein